MDTRTRIPAAELADRILEALRMPGNQGETIKTQAVIEIVEAARAQAVVAAKPVDLVARGMTWAETEALMREACAQAGVQWDDDSEPQSIAINVMQRLANDAHRAGFRLALERAALIAAQAAEKVVVTEVGHGATAEWSLGDIEGTWRDIDHTGHGGVMRIVWRMEDDERSPECEARAHAVVAALNAAAPAAPQPVPDWSTRNTDSLAGWINELGTLAQHPKRMDGWMRQALHTIYRGLAEHAVQRVPAAPRVCESPYESLRWTGEALASALVATGPIDGTTEIRIGHEIRTIEEIVRIASLVLVHSPEARTAQPIWIGVDWAADGSVHVLSTTDAVRPDWMTCETRRPWVCNSLRERAKEMRAGEKRCRSAFRKDYMGVPATYVADAFGEAAAVFETRLNALKLIGAKGDAS